MNHSLLLHYVVYVIYYYVLSNTDQAEHSDCVFNGFYRLWFSREAIASHSFGAYMGVRTCSHKTIYATKELPKARKPQPVCGVRFLSKPCLIYYILTLNANIVQRVKTCYKIKINYRESESRFHGVLLSKQHQCLTIAPLLQYNSATIRV